jgi:nucleoside-diphosphate-sugar epimerase
MTKRIGITGSTGVMGRTLLSSWKDKSAEFFPFKGDIRKREDVHQWYKDLKPDAIFHLAALVPIHLVEAEPLKAFEINVLGTLNLLEEIRLAEKKPWFFYCSTSHVYPTSNHAISEADPVSPINIYGQTKAQAEKWCEIYGGTYKFPVCTVRIFSCSSPDQPKSYFVPSMIEKVKSAPQGATLEVRGLEGTRDFLTTRQVCQAIAFLFEKRLQGTFNLGSGEPIKLLDMVEAIKTKLGRTDVKIKPIGTEHHHLVANVSKLALAGLKLSFNKDEFLEYVMGGQIKKG